MEKDKIFFENDNWEVVQSGQELVIGHKKQPFIDWPTLVYRKGWGNVILYESPHKIPKYIKREVQKAFAENNSNVVFWH